MAGFGAGALGRRRRSAGQSARLLGRGGCRGGQQGLRRRPADRGAGPRRPGDHPGRRAQADRHRLLRRDHGRHAAGRRGAGQRQGEHGRSDRGQHRRPDHLHRQLHHPGRERHPVRRQRSRGDRAGAQEGARPGHPCGRLRRQRPARCPRVVRQPGRVQRHRQGDDRCHGRGDRGGRQLRHRHQHLHHAQSGPLDRRDVGLCRRSAIPT